MLSWCKATRPCPASSKGSLMHSDSEFQRTPANNRLNHDRGYELPGQTFLCTPPRESVWGIVHIWCVAVECMTRSIIVHIHYDMKKLRGETSSGRIPVLGRVHAHACTSSAPIKLQHFDTSLHYCPEDN